MRDASSRLFQSLFDVYELDWEGGEDLGAVVEVILIQTLTQKIYSCCLLLYFLHVTFSQKGEDLLWNDYEAKLRDQALLTIESYISQFPDMRVITHLHTHTSHSLPLFFSMSFNFYVYVQFVCLRKELPSEAENLWTMILFVITWNHCRMPKRKMTSR